MNKYILFNISLLLVIVSSNIINAQENEKKTITSKQIEKIRFVVIMPNRLSQFQLSSSNDVGCSNGA